MKKIFSNHFLMRCSALLPLALCLGLYLPCGNGRESGADNLMCALAGGNMMLCIYPLSYEDLRFSRWMLISFLVIYDVLICIPWPIGRFKVACLAVILLLVIFMAVSMVRKFSCLRSLFESNSVLYRVEDEARAFSICLLLSILILYLALNHFMVALPAIALFVLQWMRAYSGRTLFLSSSKERILRERAERMFLNMTEPTLEEAEKMNRMYERIIYYVRTERPFLLDNFSIHDLAREIGSNRVYVSHVINVCAKMNFRQMLNYYRIKYAVELMEKHPSMKLIEVALMAGFHSNVNFNLSFKLIMQMSPSDYRKAKLRQRE